MRSIIRNKQGQFVVVAALIIAVLTLATVISVYEISINSQSIAYKPVDEFLLGITSDMNRALTVALSKDSTERVNGQTPTAADAAGEEFMDNWQQSLFTAYPNYGFELNQPISTSFKCDWDRNPGYSSALTTYDFDVASYGFIGWEGQTLKHVQLQLLTVSRDDPTHTNLTFKLTQSAINENSTVSISDIPSNPEPSTFKIGAYTLGEAFSPVTTTSYLVYHGDGVYSAIFSQSRDLTKGVRLDLMIPGDEIWVSATLRAGEGSTDLPVTPVLTTTPPSNAAIGQAFHDTAILSGATSDATGTVTYNLYSGAPGTGIQIGNPSTVDVTNGKVPDSALYSTIAVGQYYFVAYYSGDSNNNAVIGIPEEFTVGNIEPQTGKANPNILTTPPGAQIGIPSTSISVTAPIFTQTTYSAYIKAPTSNDALGITTSEGYWIGQIPLLLTNGTSAYQAIAFCMNFNKDISIGSTNPSTLTPIQDDATWRAASYIISWTNPTTDNEAAVEQVALWKTLDPSYQRPSWISTTIDNQAAALASLAVGKDVVRQDDTLRWISPLSGNTSSISLIPGSTITFTGQLTSSTEAPRPNVKLEFAANLNADGSSLPLNSTYVNPLSSYTDSQGQFQVNIKVPSDTPLGATITIQASSKSDWPQNYVDLTDPQHQDLLVTGPTLNLDLSTNIWGSIDVAAAAVTGTPFFDKATLTDATSNAQGTVTYTLYSGNYPLGNQIGVSQVNVANGVIPNSSNFTVNSAGSYYFLAAYSGDGNNNAALGTPEPFMVYANIGLSTTPPANAIAGTPFFDQATLSGATGDATGTVTYTLFRGTYPTGSPIGTGTVTVANGIVPNSTSFTVTMSGPYYFIAQYSGDSNNNPVNGEVEPFTVSMPQYSGIPIYYCGSGTQNPWLDDLPPTTSDKINSYISIGHTTSIVKALAGLPRDVVVSNKVNVTLYLGTSQPVNRLTIDIGFYYQGTYYDIGSATIYHIPKSSSNKPYTAVITIDVDDQVFVAGHPPLTVPEGSIISVTTTAPGYNGRLTLYYGPGQLSQINL